MSSARRGDHSSRPGSLTSSFGASSHGSYRVVGTKGDVFVSDAYEFADPKKIELTMWNKSFRMSFPKRDQVAAELLRFSECVLSGREPEPSGREGLADVRIIRASTRETIVVTKETFVAAGDTVQTQADGKATVQMIDGSVYSVRPNSTVVIRDNSSIFGGKYARNWRSF